MPVLRAVGRPMLASIFIMQGFDNLRRPERVAPLVEPVVRTLSEQVPALAARAPGLTAARVQTLTERVPALPVKAEQAVRVKGAVHLAVGSMLALGRWPRLSSLVLAATLVPTTLAAHRFWEAEDAEERTQKRIHFVKNLSILGGLLITAADTAGNRTSSG